MANDLRFPLNYLHARLKQLNINANPKGNVVIHSWFYVRDKA
jgi:hypothetical protein